MGQMSTKQFFEMSLCLLIISSENHILREHYIRELQCQCSELMIYTVVDVLLLSSMVLRATLAECGRHLSAIAAAAQL